jgi:hypothetical protein
VVPTGSSQQNSAVQVVTPSVGCTRKSYEGLAGAPGETRTPGLQIRSLPLYPSELQARSQGLLFPPILTESSGNSEAIRHQARSFFITFPETSVKRMPILPTGLSGRAHVNMNAPQMAQLAVANASAGISGGTRIADGGAHSFVSLAGLGALGGGIPLDDFLRFGVGETFPITLSTNEGITVAWGATALATGSVEVSFIAEWAEAS